MEKSTRIRGVMRGQFTKKAKLLENMLETAPADVIAIRSIFKSCKDLLKELIHLDEKILDFHVMAAKEEEIAAEIEDTDKYKSYFFKLETKYELYTEKVGSTSTKKVTSSLKLPKLEIPKFNGDIKQWLPFWAQFKKIHENQGLSEEDKFIYLLQSISEGEARELVESYPITSENYKKCVDHLRGRYGREDLQTQIYVRELLALVINKEAGRTLTTLYDKINAQLRSLETLGVTKKNAAFLLPMVESALPEDCLKEWQRSCQHSDGMEAELNNLLEFLKGEVDSEQRMKMAQTNTLFNTEQTALLKPSTAECLVATEKRQIVTECIWCGKSNHSNLECFRLYRLSIEDRKKIITDKKACTICLKLGHFARRCKSNIKCLSCGKRHSTAMCNNQHATNEGEEDRTSSAKAKVTTSSTSMVPMAPETTLLQTLIVEIENNGKKIPVRALFDSGSQRTYIKEEIAKILNLNPVSEEVLTHSVFGGKQMNSKIYKNYKFNIFGMGYQTEITALGQPLICTDVPKLKPSVNLSKLLKLHNIDLTDIKGHTGEIGILIGADYSGKFLTNNIVHLPDTGLVAIQTRLGWTVQGKQVSVNTNNITTNLFCANTVNLTDYWSLETLGIKDPAEMKSKEMEANEVMASFNESVKINSEGRYEVKLPFKTGYEDLLPNYHTAKKRLESTTHKIIAGNKFQQYNDVLQNWRDMGVIEEVPESDLEHTKGHYLPHRAVVKEASLTSALRPVFDASAKDKNSLCLNACLEKGINQIVLIPNLLIGFRTGAIGITSDIEKAFLQISLPPEDRNFLKFLWWEDETTQKVITYRHCRVVFGLTSSPFLLAATLSHHLKGRTGNAELLSRSWYVDNCLTSLDSEEETLKFIEESKQIMEEAKFNLRMWVTSHLGINETGKQVISVLGLNWDTSKDELYCSMGNLPDPAEVKQITKRELLSLTQKIWDPIGYTAPVMLVPKLILQELWRKELQWDDSIPKEHADKFLEWYKELAYLKDCKIPRRLTGDKIRESELSLHLFCDASKDGYAAGVVIRAEKDSKVTVQLISAKARVTPPKNISIPRKELLATLIGSRLLVQIKQNAYFKECPTYCWTDSSVVLCWIKRQLTLNNFVGNRVKEIRQNTNISDWRHIPGADNWMDLASRGCTARTLYESRWWEGPEWLRLTPEQWPRSEVIVDEKEVLAETKMNISCIAQVFYDTCLLDRLQSRVSKYTRIVRIVAWIQRYLYNLRHTINKRTGELTYCQYEAAERKVIELIQENSKEYLDKDSKNLVKFKDDDGLIRIKTKLTLSDFPEGTRSPYLLPGKNPVTKLMVRQRHEQLQHAGSDQLIVDLRTRFWIIGIRRLTKSVVSNCVICNRYNVKPAQAPTAPLPPERVMSSAPWQNTGVDLAGPLVLRNGEKCWIVLFTCAVYRAVSLDICLSLSTEAFMMTLRRFIARRGRMDLLISDQGTNFQGAKSLLSALDWEEIQRISTVRRIRWKMNAPSAAWWGGFFERMIKTMKELLRKIIGNASLSYDELQTLLCECEAVINGRPLTYINDDNNQCLEPLTPAHFILPASQPTTEVSDLDIIDSKSLNKRLTYIHSLRVQFNERFKSEYLTLLVQRGKEKQTILKEGDVVLVETPDKKIKWPLGLIQRLVPGRDGVKRTAEVKTKLGIKVRPIQRLYRLEISDYNIEDKTIIENKPKGKEDKTISQTETVGNKGLDIISIPDRELPKRTRSDRQVKIPSKFNIYQRF